jgi:hypothetical protein
VGRAGARKDRHPRRVEQTGQASSDALPPVASHTLAHYIDMAAMRLSRVRSIART